MNARNLFVLPLVTLSLAIAGLAAATAASSETAEVQPAMTRLHTAELTYDRQELQRSIDSFTRLASENPANAIYAYDLARAYFPLIDIYEGDGDVARAEEAGEQGLVHAREAVQLDPTGNPDAYRLLGDYYGRLSDFKSIFARMRYGGRSQEHHRKGLEMAPDSALAVIGVGTDKLYAPAMFGGDVEEAVKLFSRAAEMAPTWASPQIWLGRAYRKLGETELADQALARALEIQPQSGFARLEAGRFRVVPTAG